MKSISDGSPQRTPLMSSVLFSAGMTTCATEARSLPTKTSWREMVAAQTSKLAAKGTRNLHLWWRNIVHFNCASHSLQADWVPFIRAERARSDIAGYTGETWMRLDAHVKAGEPGFNDSRGISHLKTNSLNKHRGGKLTPKKKKRDYQITFESNYLLNE